jgi:LPS-assembly lipoprotein
MDRRRRRLLTAGLLGGAALLSGCRVRPLYGSFDPEGPNEDYRASEDLQAIAVSPISDRSGQILYNALLNRLTPAGVPANPAYKLVTTTSESVGASQLRTDATATRALLIVNANYTLVLAAHPQVQLVSGGVTTLSAYNIVESEYATYRAEVDARERALEELASRIRQRLASWFIEARADGTLARKLYIGE